MGTYDVANACDINFTPTGGYAADSTIVAKHLNHSHRNALNGTLVRRTNLNQARNPPSDNTIGSGDESWSPDGRTIAFSKRDSLVPGPLIFPSCTIYLVASDPADGNALRKFSSPTPGNDDYDPSWSPLGTPIVWDRNDALILKRGVPGLDADTTERRVFAAPPNPNATQVAVSPDGKNVAFAYIPANNIFVVPIDSTVAGLGQPVRVTNAPNVTDSYPKWSPDGKTILFFRVANGRSDLYTAKYPPTVPGGEPGLPAYLPPSGIWAEFPSYSADGKIVLAGLGPPGPPPGPYVLNTIDPGLGTAAPAVPNYAEFVSPFPVPRQSPDGTRTALLSRPPGVGDGSYQVWAARRNMDLPPVISSVGGKTIVHQAPFADFIIGQDSTLTLTYLRSDPEGNALTDNAYFLQPGMSFTPSTQTLSWPVGEVAVGVYTVKFAVTEASGGTDYALARITVRDITPPAGITDLDFYVDAVDCTQFHLTWTAPADDSNFVATGPATQYGFKSSSSPITSDWGAGTALPLTPGTPGTPQTYQVGVGFGQRRYIEIKTKDEIPNWSGRSNQIRIDGPPSGSSCVGGGGMLAAGGGPPPGSRVQPAAAAASLLPAGTTWSAENSLLNGVAVGTRASDLLRLQGSLTANGSVYSIRIREVGGRAAGLDDARLLTVDHSVAVRTFMSGGKAVLGSRVPPLRATDGAGVDVTSSVDGTTTNSFAGDSGAVLTAQLSPDSAATPDPVVIEASGAGSAEILLQVPDGAGDWRTLAGCQPRLLFDEIVVDSVGASRVRLQFLGPHQVRFVGRVARSSEQPVLQWAQLLSAQDSRLGDALSAVLRADTASATLAGPDTLMLSFAAPPLAAGQVRECFLAVDATPLAPPGPAALPLRGGAVESIPTRFALWQNQPNPFAFMTTLRFDLPVGAMVRLEVFDIEGRRVMVVTDHYYPAGYQAVQWDRRESGGSLVRPGVYLYRLTAGPNRDQKKMVLLP